jgi:hypothetical protein
LDGLLVFPAGADSSLPPSSSIISFINAVAFFGSSSFDRHLRQLQPAFSFMLHVPAFCPLLKVKQGGLRQAVGVAVGNSSSLRWLFPSV